MTNPLREQMTRDAIEQAKAQGEAATVETVAKFLPPDFELGPEDIAFDASVAPTPPEEPSRAPTIRPRAPRLQLANEPHMGPSGEMPPTPQVMSRIEPAPEISAAPAAVAETPTPRPPTREEQFAAAGARAVALEQERAELRIELDLANNAEVAARNERDRVAHAFAKGFGPPISQAELIRQHIGSENETRRKIVAGELPGRHSRPVGGSMVDKFAAAQRGGRLGFAGAGYRRGAFPASKRGMVIPPKQ